MEQISWETVTACGEDCSGCAKKKNGLCKGCIEADGCVPEWAASGRCPVHACCRDHRVPFCGLCSAFPCARLPELVHWNPDIVARQRGLAELYRRSGFPPETAAVSVSDASAVKKQYASSEKLDTRISIHEKYSVNRQGFGSWIASHYRFAPGFAVLELGCGTGSLWQGQEDLIRTCSRLVLTDLSEGMLQKAKEKLDRFENIEFRTVDIQDIPFAAHSFDAVIANMMLYHVPDLRRGLDEVRRVLKPGGAFYCATYGEHGILEYLSGLFGVPEAAGQANHSFTLQNGAVQLQRYFADVRRDDYPDALAVTDAGDLADYILSLSGMTALRDIPRDRLVSVLEANMSGGVLTVPKEYGMFISRP